MALKYIFLTILALSSSQPMTTIAAAQGSSGTACHITQQPTSFPGSRTLVTNPLLAATFLGGTGDDIAYPLVLDNEGNVFIAGYAQATAFPTTAGAYDESYNGGDYDVFVAKLSADLSTLHAATLLGGSGAEAMKPLVLDGEGNVYLTERTSSPDFPVSSGAYNDNYGGSWDVYIAKFNPHPEAVSRFPWMMFIPLITGTAEPRN